jgi:hypothetical protein
VNLAESATGLPRYIQNFQRFAPEVCPDLVLVALYLGNDVVDYKLSELERVAPPADAQEGERGWQRRLYAELERRILVLAIAYRTLQAHLPLLRQGTLEGNLAYVSRVYGLEPAAVEKGLRRVDPDLLDRARADVVNSWDVALAVAEPDLYRDMLSLDEPTGHARAARAMLADLARLAGLVEEAGARLVVVSIPPSASVDRRYHGFYRRMGYRMEDRLVRGRSRLAETLDAHLQRRGTPHLDLTPTLRSATQDVYLPDDIHFDAEGQRIAGLALAGFLGQGLLELDGDRRECPLPSAETRGPHAPAAKE